MINTQAYKNFLHRFIGRKSTHQTPAAMYRHYSKLSRKQHGLRQFLVLSFDCDTPDDAEAAGCIAAKFREQNIPAVFAIPGKRLEDARGIYQALARSGFEFLNHGYLDHATYDHQKKRYYSITWYHQMSADEIRQDIRQAHVTLQSEIEVVPQGFRAPHFGHFQQPEQLDVIYAEIARLGYLYATTTMPEQGLHQGAVFPVSYNLMEFPLTGTFDAPAALLDSWCFLAAPDRIYTETDYITQFQKMVDFFSKHRLPCILNFYVDPSHVVHFTGFFDCIGYALEKNFEITTYSRILAQLREMI